MDKALDTWSKIKKISNETPEKVFCYHIGDNEKLTINYRQLINSSESLASHISNLKVSPNSVVLIILPHCPELYYSFCAVMAVNAIPSFMPFPTSK